MKGEQHHYPITKKDESLRNFHWCLIRTLHNYPFLTDGKSINNVPLIELAGNQHDMYGDNILSGKLKWIFSRWKKDSCEGSGLNTSESS